MAAKKEKKAVLESIPKAPTGIQGLDEITFGGLPKGRPILVAGTPGCGKTLLGMQFIVNGITKYGEPGIYVPFEETKEELISNFAAMFELQKIIDAKKMIIDHVRIERSEIEETGEYDLEGLFIRLGNAIDTIGAKRVVLDTLEALFAGLSNEGILRAELRRLFTWLKNKGVTALITGEPGKETITKYGLEEYVADCVICLEHRVEKRIATRNMRVIKYRGSKHGTNSYPYLIDEHGISVMPITSLSLEHKVTNERVSTGIKQLDEMLGHKGLYRGSSALITGTAGTGKTSFAAHVVDAACARGERCLFFLTEESPDQVVRNMRSIGLNLEKWTEKGLLRFHAARPGLFGLEMHLLTMYNAINEFMPATVILDPISNFTAVGEETEIKIMLTRVIDFLKLRKISLLCTSLTSGGAAQEATSVGVSSLMDSWILLNVIESGGERNRLITVVKSRGMAHSSQAREFSFSSKGIQLRDIYSGPAGVLTGTARTIQETRERMDKVQRNQEIERRQRELERKRKLLESQISVMKTQFESEQEEIKKFIAEAELREQEYRRTRAEIAELRGEDISKRKPGE